MWFSLNTLHVILIRSPGAFSSSYCHSSASFPYIHDFTKLASFWYCGTPNQTQHSMCGHQCWSERKDHFSQPTGRALPNKTREVYSLLCLLECLLNSICYLFIHICIFPKLLLTGGLQLCWSSSGVSLNSLYWAWTAVVELFVFL